MAWHGVARPGQVWPGLAWPDVVWRGPGWRVLVWPGLVWIPCGFASRYSETFNKRGVPLIQGIQSFSYPGVPFRHPWGTLAIRGVPRYPGGPLEIQEKHLNKKKSMVFKENLWKNQKNNESQ